MDAWVHVYSYRVPWCTRVACYCNTMEIIFAILQYIYTIRVLQYCSGVVSLAVVRFESDEPYDCTMGSWLFMNFNQFVTAYRYGWGNVFLSNKHNALNEKSVKFEKVHFVCSRALVSGLSCLASRVSINQSSHSERR